MSRETRTKAERKRCESCGKRLISGRRRSCLRALRAGRTSSSPQRAGRVLEFACAVQPHAFRTVRRSSPRRRLGGLPARSARFGKTPPVGPGADGHPGERPDPPTGPPFQKAHPCRGAGRPRRPVGDGGGSKMHCALRRHRRDLGRPPSARLHRDETAGGGLGAKRHSVLAGAAGRRCGFERGTDALADRERSIPFQRFRWSSAGSIGVGCRAVSRAWIAARTLDRCP